jgi:YggT family protein
LARPGRARLIVPPPLRGRAGADSLGPVFAMPGGSSRAMNPFASIVDIVIRLYIWVVIGSAIMSWLVAFNVVNTRNRFVYQVGDVLYRLTEPALRPIRRVVPTVGGLDLSPVVLLLLLFFIRSMLFWYVF